MLIPTSFILMQYTAVTFKKLLQPNRTSSRASGPLDQVIELDAIIVLFSYSMFKDS